MIYSQFSEEREQLVRAKKECESKFNISKLEIKLELKEETIKELQKRIVDIREESESEICKHRVQIKEYKQQEKEVEQWREEKQSEVDKLNASLIEKQTQVYALDEALRTLQQKDIEEIEQKYLDQVVEFSSIKAINRKLEKEVSS